MDGTTADSLQMAAAMNLKMDLTAFLDAMSQVAGQASELTAEDQALLDALKSEGMDMEIRADMEKGVMYLTMGGSALETLGLPADTWYSFDMASMYGQMGLDYTALIDASKTMDASALLQTALQSADLSDKDTAYATVSALVNGAAQGARGRLLRKERRQLYHHLRPGGGRHQGDPLLHAHHAVRQGRGV